MSISDAIPFKELAEHFPGRPSKITLTRWCTVGVRGVVLDSFFSGGQRFVLPSAIEAFIAAQNDGKFPATESPAERSRRRRKEVKAAEEELAAAGI